MPDANLAKNLKLVAFAFGIKKIDRNMAEEVTLEATSDLFTTPRNTLKTVVFPHRLSREVINSLGKMPKVLMQ